MTNFGLEQYQAANQNPTLTPNTRLAEAWVSQYYRKINPDSEIIAQPLVKTLSEWARGVLQEALALRCEAFPALINQHQQLALWETAITADRDIVDQNQVSALAGLARSAERQLRQWEVYVPDAAVNDQFRRFLRWRGRFKQLKTENDFATAEDQMKQLAERLTELDFASLPEKVTLFGFLETTRIEKALLRQLGLRGVEVEYLDLEGDHEHGECTLARFTDFHDEILAAAKWAEDALQQGAGGVAIVINDIDSNSVTVRHILEQNFHPDGLACGRGMQDTIFHIPSGESLLSQQVVVDALLLLELSLSSTNKPWPAAKISRFLLSPYTSGAREEQLARAQLELHMRKTQAYEPSLDSVRRWLELDKFKSTAPVLEDLVCGLATIETDAPLAVQMASRLKYWGWGESVRGHDYSRRCISRFLKLLEDLAFLRPETAGHALKLINTLCRDTRITTCGGELSPIQVLSPEAAIGRCFDAVRVLNMRQDNWPAKPSQNGLIPPVCWPLLGRATVESEFDHARQVTGMLKSLAPSVRFSWTDHDNGVEMLPSALLTGLGVPATVEPAPESFWQSLFEPAQGTQQLEVRPEQPGLALDCEDNKRLPGGAGLFAEQASAPMAAYCRRRLGAEWWDLPGPFVDAAFRGQVLHSALEHLYKYSLAAGGLPDINQVPAAVSKALKIHRAKQKMTAPAFAAEITRLEQLLAEWLFFDQSRPEFLPFSLECRELVDWQGFEISLRIDRIDRLAEGRLLIIDYKSGSNSTSGWADERLRNPQLPLYAHLYELHTGQAVSGICLAGARINDCSYAGYGDEPIDAFDGLRVFGGRKSGLLSRFECWDELRSHWQEQLEVLFTEIRQGHCENRVYNSDQLTYLGLDSLLRVAEGEHWLSEHQG